MVLIFVDHVGSRIGYIIQFMLQEIAGIEYEIIYDATLFLAFDGPKFSYGCKQFNGVLHIQASGLLHERDITSQAFTTVTYEGVNCPF